MHSPRAYWRVPVKITINTYSQMPAKDFPIATAIAIEAYSAAIVAAARHELRASSPSRFAEVCDPPRALASSMAGRVVDRLQYRAGLDQIGCFEALGELIVN